MAYFQTRFNSLPGAKFHRSPKMINPVTGHLNITPGNGLFLIKVLVMPKCALCEREVSYLTKHHLVPRQKGGTMGKTVELCSPCHKTLHATFTNTELVQRHDTLEKLKTAPELQPYLKWIKKRDLERITVRRKKN